jgi:glycosyltransferase involved in cell wall biosynthesis
MKLKQKTILFIAFHVNPSQYKGRLNWEKLFRLSQRHRLVVLTHTDNRNEIKKYLEQHSELDFYFDNISFEYVGLPELIKNNMSQWLYEVCWYAMLPFVIFGRDICFNSVCLGNFPEMPVNLLGRYGLKIIFSDLPVLSLYRLFGTQSSVLRKTIRKEVNNFSYGKAAIFNSTEKFRVLSTGRFITINGFDITISAFAEFFHRLPSSEQQKTELILAGSGPALKSIEKLIRKKNLLGVVKIIKTTDKNLPPEVYNSASVFMLPSFGKSVNRVNKAMSAGLPILCFKNSFVSEHVPEYSELKVLYSNYKSCIHEFAWDLNTLYSTPLYFQTESQMSFEKYQEQTSLQTKGFHSQQPVKSL